MNRRLGVRDLEILNENISLEAIEILKQEKTNVEARYREALDLGYGNEVTELQPVLRDLADRLLVTGTANIRRVLASVESRVEEVKGDLDWLQKERQRRIGIINERIAELETARNDIFQTDAAIIAAHGGLIVCERSKKSLKGNWPVTETK